MIRLQASNSNCLLGNVSLFDRNNAILNEKLLYYKNAFHIAVYVSFCIAPIKITTSIVLAISQQICFCATFDQPLLFLRFSFLAEIWLII
ncbi:hypothetical protein T08_993 [Trichinella sp. T8]|nr:hypothetical protein T08_993 [Trichinella sp. T8]